jgi:hypothetical protein
MEPKGKSRNETKPRGLLAKLWMDLLLVYPDSLKLLVELAPSTLHADLCRTDM